MGLAEYRAKRDFRRTAEPAGSRRAQRQRQLMFVVQKHAASHLHYDFRLEMEGVLKSWAVPKGFPFRKGERRLAMRVEDHPIEYAHFEGTIAPGNYGAGTVMVWDTGPYQVQAENPRRALEQGKLHLTLSGKKLLGDWTLVRMRRAEEDDREQWLVLKSGEDAEPLSARAEDQSVLTRRSLAQIAADNDAQWSSNRPAAKSRSASPLITTAPVVKLPRSNRSGSTAASATTATALLDSKDPAFKKLPRAKPGFVEPMKALLCEKLPKGPGWLYEVKFDGYRALAIKNKDSIKLISRNAKDLTGRYASISEALRELPAKSAVLDGEVVAMDPQGRSSFQLLQSYLTPGSSKPPLYYYVFDLVNLEGGDLTGLPLNQRKALLGALLEKMPDAVRFSASLEADAERLIREMRKRGLEGLIAKEKKSKYEVGQRSGSWIKYKWSHEQEFVIGGYTPPKRARPFFGAVLVGYYQDGQLIFASKVGSGFDEKLLSSLYERFQKLIRSDCPFANLPESIPSGLTAYKMKECTWLKPELVCQVRFTEWTRDQHLRHPLFLGLREDKAPSEVVREQPADLSTWQPQAPV